MHKNTLVIPIFLILLVSFVFTAQGDTDALSKEARTRIESHVHRLGSWSWKVRERNYRKLKVYIMSISTEEVTKILKRHLMQEKDLEIKMRLRRLLDSAKILLLLRDQFIQIKPREFRMGSSKGPKSGLTETSHTVILTKGFWMQKTEVTQRQWFLVMGENPSRFKERKKHCPRSYVKEKGVSLCPKHPVENVSWKDVQRFFSTLNFKNDGYTYRLPTEAEWEYAAGGGKQTDYSFGNNPKWLRHYGWYSENHDNQTKAIAQKKANPFGLFDVHGNVWEWVSDWYANYPTGKITNPTGPKKGMYRVFRGGSWNDGSWYLRSAKRAFGTSDSRSEDVGFRLLRTLNP